MTGNGAMGGELAAQVLEGHRVTEDGRIVCPVGKVAGRKRHFTCACGLWKTQPGRVLSYQAHDETDNLAAGFQRRNQTLARRGLEVGVREIGHDPVAAPSRGQMDRDEAPYYTLSGKCTRCRVRGLFNGYSLQLHMRHGDICQPCVRELEAKGDW